MTSDEQRAQKREYDKAYRSGYAERKRQLRKNWRDAENSAANRRRRTRRGWAVSILGCARYRAKKKGIEFRLGLEDIVIPDVCPVLGIPLEAGTGSTRAARDISPSLDRLDNEKGYVPGNVRVISWRANRIKSDATAEELAAILAYMQEGVS